MPSRCPECNTPTDPGALACTHCPASWEDEHEDYRRPQRRREYVPGPVMWIAVLLIAGLCLWKGIIFVMALADPDNAGSPVKQFVDNNTDLLDPNVAAATQGGASTIREGVTGQTAANVPPVEEDAPSGDDGSAPSSREESWRFVGRVYDLTNLEPVPKAVMSFEDSETGRKREIKADGMGRYRTSLPPLQGRGYYVRIRKEGYAAGYLNPGTENVREMSTEDRAVLARDVSHSMDVFTVQAYGSDPLTTDFYLAPKKD